MRMIPNLMCQPYEERLESHRIFTLERERLTGDMIVVFKCNSKLNSVDFSKIFEFQTDSRTRNNGLPLKERRYGTDLGKKFLLKRVVKHWSSLPAKVVDSHTINTFKRRLDFVNTLVS